MFEKYICTLPTTLEFPLCSHQTTTPNRCQALRPWGSRPWHQHYPTVFNGSHLPPQSSLTPHADKWGLCLAPTSLPVTSHFEASTSSLPSTKASGPGNPRPPNPEHPPSTPVLRPFTPPPLQDSDQSELLGMTFHDHSKLQTTSPSRLYFSAQIVYPSGTVCFTY